MKQQISILGCGWLGLPLAKHLIQEGHLIKGSTTSFEKFPILENHHIQPFQIELKEESTIGSFDEFLNESKILIIDIPPKLRGTVKENFVQKIKNSIPFIEQSTVEKVIFVSSTSVYADTEEIPNITEDTIPNPDSESGKQLFEVEQLLINNTNFKTTILRFGGLIGENRNPIFMLTGRINVGNPKAPINFIHQKDCIGIISAIIKQDCWNEIFNGVGLNHIAKETYYNKKANELNLTPPLFDYETPSVGKIVMNDKIQNILNYTIKMPN